MEFEYVESGFGGLEDSDGILSENSTHRNVAQ